MPGLVTIKSRVNGGPWEEPRQHVFESGDLVELVVQARIRDPFGFVHLVETELVFDPPLVPEAGPDNA